MRRSGDFAALLAGNTISFYKITDDTVNAVLPAAAAPPACKNFDFIHFEPNVIALFRITENNNLVCDVYTVSVSGYFIKRNNFAVINNVRDLCCADEGASAKLYAVSGNKLHIYDIVNIGNAVSAVKTDVEISDTSAVSAAIEKGRVHMLLADLKNQRYYAYTDSEIMPETDNFNLSFKFLSRWSIYN